MAEAPPPTPQDNVRRLVTILYFSGAVTAIAGIALGIAISPALFGLVALGIFDFAIGTMFASGRIGPLAARRKAVASGDAAQVAEADPSFNPYARED